MKCYINGDNFIRLLFSLMKLFKLKFKNVVKFCVHVSPIPHAQSHISIFVYPYMYTANKHARTYIIHICIATIVNIIDFRASRAH